MAFYHQILDGQLINSIIENTSDDYFKFDYRNIYGKKKLISILDFLNNILRTDITLSEINSPKKIRNILLNYNNIIDSFYTIKIISSRF